MAEPLDCAGAVANRAHEKGRIAPLVGADAGVRSALGSRGHVRTLGSRVRRGRHRGIGAQHSSVAGDTHAARQESPYIDATRGVSPATHRAAACALPA
jgi:hypothetical protein